MVYSLILFTFVINMTGGYIRLFYTKGSRARIRCFYIPVTIAILLRFIFDLSYEYLPIFVATALIGLFLGGILHRFRHPKQEETENVEGECL